MALKTLRRLGCTAAFLLLVLAVAGILWWRGSSEPEAWQEQHERLEQSTQAERRALADGAEERLRRAARTPTPSLDPAGIAPEVAPPPAAAPPVARRPEPGAAATVGEPVPKATPSPEAGTVTLSLDELNALLEQNAARWLAQARRGGRELPLSDPLLAFEADHLVLFTQLATPGGDLLLGLPFSVEVDGAGGVVRLEGVRLGQLSLPGADALPRLLRTARDPRLDRLADRAEEATDGYAFDPVLELDGAALRVTGLSLDPAAGAVHLRVEAGG